jgi:hypothetical protein
VELDITVSVEAHYMVGNDEVLRVDGNRTNLIKERESAKMVFLALFAHWTILEIICRHIPPPCKGRLGGVEIQLYAHEMPPAALGGSWTLAFLPPFALPYKGGGFPHRSMLPEQTSLFPE